MSPSASTVERTAVPGHTTGQLARPTATGSVMAPSRPLTIDADKRSRDKVRRSDVAQRFLRLGTGVMTDRGTDRRRAVSSYGRFIGRVGVGGSMVFFGAGVLVMRGLLLAIAACLRLRVEFDPWWDDPSCSPRYISVPTWRQHIALTIAFRIALFGISIALFAAVFIRIRGVGTSLNPAFTNGSVPLTGAGIDTEGRVGAALFTSRDWFPLWLAVGAGLAASRLFPISSFFANGLACAPADHLAARESIATCRQVRQRGQDIARLARSIRIRRDRACHRGDSSPGGTRRVAARCLIGGPHRECSWFSSSARHRFSRSDCPTTTGDRLKPAQSVHARDSTRHRITGLVTCARRRRSHRITRTPSAVAGGSAGRPRARLWPRPCSDRWRNWPRPSDVEQVGPPDIDSLDCSHPHAPTLTRMNWRRVQNGPIIQFPGASGSSLRKYSSNARPMSASESCPSVRLILRKASRASSGAMP